MSKDLEIIHQIKNKTGQKLPQIATVGIFDMINGYVIDDDQHVVGLYLYDLELSDISFIQGLKHLTYLDLSYNHVSDISPLEGLQNLDYLNLSSTQVSDISSLEGLQNLTHLDLSSPRVSDLSSLEGLQNLTSLDLSSTQVSDISPLEGLQNLSDLDLSFTQVSDLSSLEGLQNLSDLDLSFTQVSDLSSLRGIKSLKSLYLSDCRISRLPADIGEWGLEIKWEWDPGGGMFLEGNPLEVPPVEIVEKGTEAVRAYFKSLALEDERVEGRALDEVKVLLVGDGGAGKTSLVKRLFGEGFDERESQTRGINIRAWQRPVGKRRIKVNFWDFGGQEIMHATHQFFFSRRSLYILVLDGRKDEDPEYWLKHIESFGGDSPILVVINKIDQNPGFDLNRKFLQDKYSTIKGFNRLSCRSEEGIEDFKKQLVARVAEMKHLQTLWPQNWFRVKTRLEEMTGDFIGFDQYEEMCRKEGIESDDARHTLVAFLHDLGVVLHFSDPALKETNVINPHWATEGVYHIVNSKELADRRGLLPRSALPGILDSDRYPKQKHDFIVELMRKFELCYCLDSTTILIPDLLAVGEPDFDFDYKTALKFQIHYDFLPRSIMPRFLVKMRRDIKGELRWRTGVVLRDGAFGASAVVRADARDKKIYIYVQGEQKRSYFSVIWKIFRDINEDFEKLAYTEWVPLPDRDDILVEYETLLVYERLGEDQIIIKELGDRCPVKPLLDGIEDEHYRQLSPDSRQDIRDFRWDVFISYSSKDLDTVKGIVKDLGRRGIRYWWDEERIEPGDSISQKIAEGLEQSRCVMPCFSRSQIESGWCRAEYTAVLNKVIGGRTVQRVTPLILDDLDLEDYPTLLGDYKYERLSDPGGYEKLLRALKRS
jgi:internalin A